MEGRRRNRVFQEGAWWALIYVFISTIISLHECILNFIGLPSKLNPGKRLNPEMSLQNFVCGVGGTEKV